MESSFESDSESETIIDPVIDQTVNHSDSKSNYEEAGKFILEESDKISLEKYEDLMDKDSVAVLDETLGDVSLPYDLSDFQKLSINILLQRKDLILLSPTGSGKVCLFYITKGVIRVHFEYSLSIHVLTSLCRILLNLDKMEGKNTMI